MKDINIITTGGGFTFTRFAACCVQSVLCLHCSNAIFYFYFLLTYTYVYLISVFIHHFICFTVGPAEDCTGRAGTVSEFARADKHECDDALLQ